MFNAIGRVQHEYPYPDIVVSTVRIILKDLVRILPLSAAETVSFNIADSALSGLHLTRPGAGRWTESTRTWWLIRSPHCVSLLYLPTFAVQVTQT